MSLPEPDEQDEKPLDPVMESVRRKMIRLQLVSAGVMVVMLMAVLGAIVYKVTRPDPKAAAAQQGASALPVPADAPLTAAIDLPEGFTVSSTSLSGGQVLFFGTLPGGSRKAFVFDIAAGRIVADIAVD
ncbi:hypothetical protein ACLE20_08300 [Rhizobium sp. YIM 134829]|uniref:hypothetical protein n=1 Tax=Rhizobium sp. YIM 134829 TaxID=3390453 RepID=UPI00397C78C1